MFNHVSHYVYIIQWIGILSTLKEGQKYPINTVVFASKNPGIRVEIIAHISILLYTNNAILEEYV